MYVHLFEPMLFNEGGRGGGLKPPFSDLKEKETLDRVEYYSWVQGYAYMGDILPETGQGWGEGGEGKKGKGEEGKGRKGEGELEGQR